MVQAQQHREIQRALLFSSFPSSLCLFNTREAFSSMHMYWTKCQALLLVGPLEQKKVILELKSDKMNYSSFKRPTVFQDPWDEALPSEFLKSLGCLVSKCGAPDWRRWWQSRKTQGNCGEKERSHLLGVLLPSRNKTSSPRGPRYTHFNSNCSSSEIERKTIYLHVLSIQSTDLLQKSEFVTAWC